MKTVSFGVNTTLDEKLTKAWVEFPGDDPDCSWVDFLRTFSGVESVEYRVSPFCTDITFEDESALYMFLLRWS